MLALRPGGSLRYPTLHQQAGAAAPAVREIGPSAVPKPRSLDCVRDAMRARHYSRRTEKTCVAWIRRYIFFHGKRHLDAVRDQHQRDLQAGAGGVEQPGALARKYPNAGREWPRQWVFPTTSHRPGAAWPPGTQYHHDLHARSHPGPAGVRSPGGRMFLS